ncbi:hypothetical protein [Brachybacterium sp.]|uniref:hypothetical protein n=1 Tax=Brachybacterium sp. TaxID=1891286 RepID=UPI002ED6534E
MQQGISRRDIYTPRVAATIAGRGVDVESMSVDRELPDPLASGSLTAATVTLTTTEGPDVAAAVVTPWDRDSQWPPVPESPASVSMDTGAGMVSVLRQGRVTSVDGGTSSREVVLEAADKYQSLDRTISWDAVMGIMPHTQEAVLPRYVSMQTLSITDMVLRHCGWYSTPPLTNYVMLSVPAQGTMWPERGYVDTSNRFGEGGYPYWALSQWGLAAADVDATYTLQGGGYTIAGRGGVELTAMTQASQQSSPGTMYLDVHAGEARLRLSWTDNHAFLRLRNPGGDYVTAASVPRVNGLLYAVVEYVSATSIRCTIRSGSNVVTEVVAVAAGLTSGEMHEARIWGQGRGGGFMVAAPGQLGTLTGWAPNAVLYPRSANRNTLRVRPSIEGENCVDLLKAQCEAECATYWIDETGVLRWWDLARLEDRATAATLTSADDIEESGFSWSHEQSSVKSRVSVKWRDPAVSMSWRTSIDLWQGNGATLQPGDMLEDWLSVPDDEIWIMPDLILGRVGDNFRDYNFGIGSWYGGIVTEDDDVEVWAQTRGSLLMSIERVTDRAFKRWVQWTGSETAQQRTPSERMSSSLFLARRNQDLPIIRGKARVTLIDRITYSAQAGPATAPEHQIDAGWWIQDAEQAQYTADFAGARLTVQQPVLSSIALIAVPGLQLGDMVEVQDDHVTYLTVRGLVVADSRSVDADMAMSHAVAVRPVSVSKNRVDWQDWGSAMAGQQWQTWGQRQQPDTWEAWASDPLEEE